MCACVYKNALFTFAAFRQHSHTVHTFATRHKFVNNILSLSLVLALSLSLLRHSLLYLAPSTSAFWIAKLLVSSNYLTHSTLRICAITLSSNREWGPTTELGRTNGQMAKWRKFTRKQHTQEVTVRKN